MPHSLTGWLAASVQQRINNVSPFVDCGYIRAPVFWHGSPAIDVQVGLVAGPDVPFGKDVTFFGIFHFRKDGYCLASYANYARIKSPQYIPETTMFITFEMEVFHALNYSLANHNVSSVEPQRFDRLWHCQWTTTDCRKFRSQSRGGKSCGAAPPSCWWRRNDYRKDPDHDRPIQPQLSRRRDATVGGPRPRADARAAVDRWWQFAHAANNRWRAADGRRPRRVMPTLDARSGTGSDAAFEFVAQAGMGQSVPAIAFPATIAANGSWTSALLATDGLRYISVGLTLSQAGSLTIARYIDAAGVVARAPITGSLVANTPLVLDAADLLPCAAFTVQVSNAAGVIATVSNPAILLAAG